MILGCRAGKEIRVEKRFMAAVEPSWRRISARLSHLYLLLLASAAGYCVSEDTLLRHLPSLNVDDFPPDFVLGAGTSAYQVDYISIYPPMFVGPG
ncbi:hypothetical protein ACLOJK_017840 [Asimina triloba]